MLKAVFKDNILSTKKKYLKFPLNRLYRIYGLIMINNPNSQYIF